MSKVMDSLEKKIIKSGVYFAEQSDYPMEDLGLTNEELAVLVKQEENFYISLAKKYFSNDLKFNDIEIEAMKQGLQEYSPYGLVVDWRLGISDFDFDHTMIDYIIENKHIDGLYEKLYIKLNELKKSIDNAK